MTSDVIQRNKVVSLTYTLRNERGEIFEHSDLPVAYLHGSGSGLFDKIESSLLGRAAGETVSVELAPDDGFGRHDPGLTFTDDVDNVPPEYRRIGAQLEAENAKGEAMTFVVTRIHDGKLTVDANHPLAGQTVRFDVTIQDVRDATPEELRTGEVKGGPPTLQ